MPFDPQLKTVQVVLTGMTEREPDPVVAVSGRACPLTAGLIDPDSCPVLLAVMRRGACRVALTAVSSSVTSCVTVSTVNFTGLYF